MVEPLEVKEVDNYQEKHNWFIWRIKKYQVITYTFGFLCFFRFIIILLQHSLDKELFLEKYVLDIWFWVIGIPIIYFLQWLLVVWVASKLPKEKLKHKFFKHPIVTIVLFLLYAINLPFQIAEYGSGNIILKIINVFETTVYYAFVSLLWWLLICWISDKLFKKLKFQWHWYHRMIEMLFVAIPIIYKFVLGLLSAALVFVILFFLFTIVLKYTGKDLNMLGS